MSKQCRAILFVMLAGIALSLSACGTMRGVGQDVQDAGQAIKRAAS